MTDTTNSSSGYGQIGASILAAFSASYLMNRFSLRGIDFEVLGFSSELVKSTIIGTLSGFFTWISPTHVVQAVTDAILFVRKALKQWHDAINNPNLGDTK